MEKGTEEFSLAQLEKSLSKTLNGKTLENVLRPIYFREVCQGINIMDIGYPICACFIIKRCLDRLTREYCECLIDNWTKVEGIINKEEFEQVKEKFWGDDSDLVERSNLLLGIECVFRTEKSIKLKEIYLTYTNYKIVESINSIAEDFISGNTEFASNDVSNGSDYEELSYSAMTCFTKAVGLIVKIEREICNYIPDKEKDVDLHFITSCTVILESEDSVIQGTAFCVKDSFFLTCYHVLYDDNKKMECRDVKAFSELCVSKKYDVRIIKKIEALDIALIEVIGWSVGMHFDLDAERQLQHLDHVYVVGYPNYRLGDTIRIVETSIASLRPYSGIQCLVVSSPIYVGNSGGPVLFAKNKKVIGIAAKGSQNVASAMETDFNGCIPISAAEELLNEISNHDNETAGGT